jgi:hypothetical protein
MLMKAKIDLTELSALFEIEHGNKLDLNKMEQCGQTRDSVAFVGRSGERNGIVAFVRRMEANEPYDSGLITVALGGAALSSFVQPMAFYTGQNIDVLRPREEMSLDVKLYYCLCIEANRFRYSTFGREANRTLRNLLVPKRECLPPWVDGITEVAVHELHRDVSAAIEK